MVSDSNSDAELREELKEKRKELSTLRTQLKAIYSQKETHYQQLHALQVTLKFIHGQINSSKSERDQLTNKVKELKHQRSTFNALTKEKNLLKEEAYQRKKELAEKFDAPKNPAEIKSLIRKLEQRLETEVMPFVREEKLRKQVKGLQAQQKKASELTEVSKASAATAAEVTEVRRQAGHLHQEVQKAAEQSQQKHERVNSLYSQLKELREQEKPIATKYLGLKDESEQLKKKIQELQSRVHELSKLFNDTEEKSLKEQIKEKTAQVSEKIKKKEKLKIDDILAYQALDED